MGVNALNIDKLSGVPIYEQIIEQMERLIAVGSLSPGEQIPSVRTLSLELSINPNTIQKAYAELELRGITTSVPGVGRFVSRDAKALLERQFHKKLGGLQDAVYDLVIAGVSEEDILSAVHEALKKAKSSKEKRDWID